MKILANDGIAKKGQEVLEKAGFEVITSKVEQDQLKDYINENNVTVLLVRSATKVRKDIIDNCPSIKIIGRGGVGMDNIDVAYAREKGIKVINTPAASSHSVAELAFAHLFSLVRSLHDANRKMPLEGDAKFKDLKKAYGKGVELKGKTLGVVGFGRIGQEAAKIALGLGMKVVASARHQGEVNVKLDFYDGQEVTFKIPTTTNEEVFKQADFLTFHIPAQKEYVVSKKELDMMKKGVFIVNAARGGVIDEKALADAIEAGKVAGAALDVFEKEPTPEIQLLMNPALSLSPHIGGATSEAQDRIGTELADQIIEILK